MLCLIFLLPGTFTFNWEMGLGISGELMWGITAHQFVVLKALPREFMFISLSLIHVPLNKFKNSSL